VSTEPVLVNRTFEKIATLQANVERVIRGKSEVVQYCIAALLAKGHILLEDVPGVGKTLAHALARSLSL
jgi:MoxR-like ATPase